MKDDTRAFKIGQRVHVEYDGEVTGFTSEGGDTWFYWINLGDGIYSTFVSQDVLTAAEPANWPPQLGDIWEAGGKEYYVRRNDVRFERVVITSFDNTGDRFNVEDFGTQNPTLVRRRS